MLVQNRVAIAMSSLPQSVQIQGVSTQKKSTAVLKFVTLFSPEGRYDSLFLSNYAVINVQNELARLPGRRSLDAILLDFRGRGRSFQRVAQTRQLTSLRLDEFFIEVLGHVTHIGLLWGCFRYTT